MECKLLGQPSIAPSGVWSQLNSAIRRPISPVCGEGPGRRVGVRGSSFDCGPSSIGTPGLQNAALHASRIGPARSR